MPFRFGFNIFLRLSYCKTNTLNNLQLGALPRAAAWILASLPMPVMEVDHHTDHRSPEDDHTHKADEEASLFSLHIPDIMNMGVPSPM